jgi:predicted extracellular nuclease
MNKFFLTVCSLSLLVLAELNAQTEVNIMSLNTEWFWDSENPHEGTIAFGPRGNPPTEMEVKLEAYSIARIISEYKANIVGLIEVENQTVADLIRSYLPEPDWKTIFIKGRDSSTGQDVALLTRFEVIAGSETNYADTPGDKRPSKILGAALNIGSETVFVIVTHFLSKRSDNDANRLKQANYVREEVRRIMNNFDHIVILGDLNDLPDSPPLQRVRGLDDADEDFIQTAITTGTDAAYSYIFNDEKQLIDHILLSPSLEDEFGAMDLGSRHKTIDLGPISDHRAVMVNIVLD